MILYDASAFFERILKKEVNVNGFILDLTFYEVGNTILKHNKMLKKIDGREAKSLLIIVSNWKNVLYIKEENLPEIFSYSISLGLSFYDASYIYFSKKYNATLETADDKLYKKAAGVIKCEFLKQG